MAGRIGHPARAAAFAENGSHMHWHDRALWFVRQKRDKMAGTVPEWEDLRAAAGQIKAHTIARLADYLEQFETAATEQGAIVHWAKDAEEHNQIVLRILKEHGAAKVAKSKSMLTEECHLNPFLEGHGIEIVDTDLGERIVQLRDEPPSHIVLPAIHLTKEDVGELFHAQLGTNQGASDPIYLTKAARNHLREKFLSADAGITGVNFAIAETGGIVVCTNEGNADLGVALPRLHIACMGIEKLVPRARDLGVFLRLLARSATGQPITSYTSHFHGPRPGGALHIVIVDHGRTELRKNSDFHRSLRCIRCGACMNTCPVFRRSGGHSYEAVVPGPIGSILGPALQPKAHKTLPFACTQCGSCTDVCPVGIDLHPQLLAARQLVVESRGASLTKRASLHLGAFTLKRPWLYRLTGGVTRWLVPKLPRWIVNRRINRWARDRELPDMPKRSFRRLYRDQGRGNRDK